MYFGKQINRQRIEQMTHSMAAVINRYYNSYSKVVSKKDVMQAMVMIVTPVMTNLLHKYDENDFHTAMNNRYHDEEGRLCFGFDFISDWKNNHPIQYYTAMPIARSMKNRLNFDIDTAAQLIADIIYSWNWRLSGTERIAIRHNLYRIKRLIQQ